jgi:transposase
VPYLAAKHRRIAARRGPLKAVVAVEHAMLVAIWHMITEQAPYRDPGPDYYARRNPDKTRDRAIDQLRVIGYDVTLTPRAITDPLHQ